jgi:LPS-assembly lipoprotein
MKAQVESRKSEVSNAREPRPAWRRFRFRLSPSAFLLAATVFLVAACGFQLRGVATLPFESIYVQAQPKSLLAQQIKRAVRTGSSTRVSEKPDDAEVTLQIVNELQERRILSLTGGGRVAEYELSYRVVFRLTDAQKREHIPSSEILLRRDYSYRDDAALSKEAEEALLYRNMRDDAVQQLVRRLQGAKLKS